MKIIQAKLNAPVFEKEDDLEDILATDDLFLQYFNEYLSLPIFLEPLHFNRDLGTFEVADGAKKKIAKRLKAAIRASKGVAKIYRPVKNHSFCTISLIPLEDNGASNIEEIDTSFSVTMLNKEQGMKWVKTHRFPTFLVSDLYVEYRLAKIVSQVDCTELKRGEAIQIALDLRPHTRKARPEDIVPEEDKDDSEDIMRRMYVSMGNTTTTDRDNWVSLARMQQTSTVTSSSLPPKMSTSESAADGLLSLQLPSLAAQPDDEEDGSVRSRLFDGGSSRVPKKSHTPRPSDTVCQVATEAGGGILDKFWSRAAPMYLSSTRGIRSGAAPRHAGSAMQAGGESGQSPTGRGQGFNTRYNEDNEDITLVFPTLDLLSSVVVGVALKHALAAVNGKDPDVYSHHLAVRSLIVNEAHRGYSLDELDGAACLLIEDNQRNIGRLHNDDGGDSSGSSGSEDSGAHLSFSTSEDKAQSAAGSHLVSSLASSSQQEGLTKGSDVAHNTIEHANPNAVGCNERASDTTDSKDSEDDGEDSALGSDEDYEECDITFRQHPRKRRPLTCKKGIGDFKLFLKGTAGERSWELWQDVDRARLMASESAQTHIEAIREKYYNQGARLELANCAKEDFGVAESFQWSLPKLLSAQAAIAEPLLTYWAPRYVLQRTSKVKPLDSDPIYKQHKWVAGAATTSTTFSGMPNLPPDAVTPLGPHADMSAPVMLPLRPKSCAPRLHTVQAQLEDKYSGPTPKEFSYCPPVQMTLPEVVPPLGCRRAHSVAAVELVRSKTASFLKGDKASTGMEEQQVTGSATRSQSVDGRMRAQSARTPASAAVPSTSWGPSDRWTAGVGSRPISSASSSATSGIASHKRPLSASDLKEERSSSRTSQMPKAMADRQAGTLTPSSAVSLTGDGPQAKRGSVAQSDVSAELFGGRRMESLLKALINECNSGKFFRKSIQTSNKQVAFRCLLFWENVQEYRHVFYGKTFNTYTANKKAREIFSAYITVTGTSYIGCSTLICKVTAQRLSPPFEDLFDSAEEYALDVLYDAWQLVTTRERTALSEVDTKTFTRSLETKTKYVLHLQRRGLLKSTDNLLEDPMEGYKDSVYDPNLMDKIPQDFKDITFEKLVRTPIYLETYRQFLQANFASTDLNCWMDIEHFRRLAPDVPVAANAKAKEIKTKYLNRRYFFGPNSPATREGLDQIMQSVGGWGNIFPDRPPDQLIIEAHAYVQERLEKKWMPLFLASRQFEELQRPDQHMADAAEAILLQKRRKNQAIYKMLESRWISSSNEIIAFRKALLNPMLSYEFQRFVSVKADSLENDVLFWKEVQKYKQMYHSHTSESFIQQKITVIINCFIESVILPTIQIDIPPEQAERILDKRREMGPYLFREAQLAVFRVLFEYWNDFCEFRSNVATEQVTTTIERHRRRAKIRERKRQQKMEEQKERELARRRALGLPIDDDDDDDDTDARQRYSHQQAELFRENEGGENQDVPKVSWSYSQYINALDREEVLSRTDEDTFSSLMDEDVFTELRRMKQPQAEASSMNVSDLRDVKACAPKDNTEPLTAQAQPASKPSRNGAKSALSSESAPAQPKPLPDKQDKETSTIPPHEAPLPRPPAFKKPNGLFGRAEPLPKTSIVPALLTAGGSAGPIRNKHAVKFLDSDFHADSALSASARGDAHTQHPPSARAVPPSVMRK